MAEWKTDGSDGGSAFPLPCVEGQHAPEFGMSLRDFFAAHALGSAVAHLSDNYTTTFDTGRVAGVAYALADAMLSERTK